MPSKEPKEYHILSLSGGKDSTALAFYIKENMPEIHEKIEYVFCDTGVDLPETYDYLNKIEVYLNKKITYIQPEKSFEHFMDTQGILPSVNRRWCTVELKAKPFKKYLRENFPKDAFIKIYIGIRADESHRATYNDYEGNAKQVYPFVDGGLFKADIEELLSKNGINAPEYYKWSNRNGCYFCFFQTKMNWINLYENHPDLYQKAIELETPRINEGGFGWNIDFNLIDLIKEESIKKIKEKYKNKPKKISKSNFLLDTI